MTNASAAHRSGAVEKPKFRHKLRPRQSGRALVTILLVGAAADWWFYRRTTERRWAREDAIPQIEALIRARHSLEALRVMQRAERALPADSHLRQIRDANTQLVDVTSQPEGAQVSIEDYMTPDGPALNLGTTPLKSVRIPRGYFRWSVKPGVGKMVVAPGTERAMDFPLALAQKAPPGMVYAAGGPWENFNGFIGWMGPYHFPAYDVDRYEVSNREYQEFVNEGGYEKPQYWPAKFYRSRTNTAIERSNGIVSRHDRPPRPLHLDGRTLSRGQGRFPGFRSELV